MTKKIENPKKPKKNLISINIPQLYLTLLHFTFTFTLFYLFIFFHLINHKCFFYKLLILLSTYKSSPLKPIYLHRNPLFILLFYFYFTFYSLLNSSLIRLNKIWWSLYKNLFYSTLNKNYLCSGTNTFIFINHNYS